MTIEERQSDNGQKTYFSSYCPIFPLPIIICYRVSQINGCAPCLDMHAKDLLVEGESGQRLFVLSAWRETPFYSDREPAALAWAESVTSIAGGEVSDDVYEAARKEFSDEELIDLADP